MPELLGFDVWVEMERVKLQEYKAETSNNGTEVSCWIPCEAGKVRVARSARLKRPSLGGFAHFDLLELSNRMHYTSGTCSFNSPQA